ncbi:MULTISPECIES: ferritin-like domain-containing protein [unclassified Bosea (in: a-proteobacteria)]|uniref:ferritin-like domain-containing protein n=1 Tax=unclassified Bosea (in: a-proteobacteria) TaxID=2653178 RepID=UPI000F751D52|nr:MULTISPECIES: ferritin-like domain-containing protein [unclassified Bosea (in: a-proteobacteria)]AZO82218.1 hypothetical protein BLM15_30260 [Bosea sp. Tri-49]RXT24693.1 hypothetical protein B5U98_08390 [Bosea sp. Tri-39]RXT42540.1 hypothetical protein B5U99_00860 [Bosea sp. Tri-54]
MTNREDHLMDWLRDAHAMEQQAITMLSALAGRIENYPELKEKIEEHLVETKRQASQIESCIERRGGDTSIVKDFTAKFVAMGQGLSGAFVGDEIIKSSMAGYTFEHMEIAAYRTLITASDAVGDPETSAVCARIMGEEEAMASWLADNLPAVTAKYLARDEMDGVQAKH